jgi:WD40 repeat protein
MKRSTMSLAAAITVALLGPAARTVADVGDPPSVAMPYTKVADNDGKEPMTTTLAFSGDGKLLAVGYKTGRIRLYDVPNKTWLRWLDVTHKQAIISLAVSPDGTLVASCEGDPYDRYTGACNTFPYMRLSSTETGKVVRGVDLGENTVRSLAFTEDGRTLVGGGSKVFFWSIPDGTLTRTLEFNGCAPYIAVAAGRLAIESDKTYVCDLATGSVIALHALSQTGGPIALSADGKYALSASGYWDVDHNRPLGKTYVQLGSFGFAASGDYAVGGSEEDGIYIWDGHTGATIATLEFNTDLSALSPDGKLLAVADSEGGLFLVAIDIDKARAAAYVKAHPSAKELANRALIDAVLKKDGGGVRTALKSGADPNCVIDSHGPPLWECASTERLDIFTMLIKAGAKIHPKDEGGRTDIVSMSIGSKGVKILSYLIAHGEKVGGDEGAGWLWQAVQANSVAAAKLLLDHGAPIDGYSDYKTALMSAAEKGEVEMVVYLLKRGANRRKLSMNEHRSAYQYALLSGNASCIHLLRNGAPGNGRKQMHQD